MTASKPTLVFFSPSYRLREFMRPALYESFVTKVETWLSMFFELVVITQDCDLTTVISSHHPDILLFDSVTEEMKKLGITIQNSHLFPEIPRAGLARMNTQTLSFGISCDLFNTYGVKKIFSLAPVADIDNFNEQLQTLVPIPPFVEDSDIFESSDLRHIPVALFNELNETSPLSSWSKIAKRSLLDSIACLDMSARELLSFTQEQIQVMYQRTVIGICLDTIGAPPENLALQIAASGALLVAPPLPALKRLGFRHLENCLMPEADEINSIIDFVLLNPQRLSQIAKAGQDVVKSRFLMNHRSEILDWFQQKTTVNVLRHPGEASIRDTIVRKLDELLALGELDLAERRCRQWTNSINWAPGLVLRHTFIKLLQGLPSNAINIISPLIIHRFNLGSAQPDPIQWAMLLLCIFVNRDFEGLRDHLKLYPDLYRMELDIVRWVLAIALDEKTLAAAYVENLTSHKNQAQTIHTFGSVSREKTLKVIDLILQRCHMGALCEYMWEQAKLQGILGMPAGTTESKSERITA